jgi:ABC-2 type transport system permease protein
VPRARIIHAKIVAALVYTLALSLMIAVVGLVAGSILFPHHQVVTLSGVSISFLHGVGEAMLAALVVGASIFSVTMVGIAVSTFTSSSLAATSIAVTVAIVSEVLDAIPQLEKIRPILLSNYWSSFINIFRSPIIAGPIYKDLLEQLGWMAVFYLLAVFNFSQRDITS